MSYRRRYYATETPVTTQVLAPGAVTEEKLATGAVSSRAIMDRQIKAEDIALGAIKLEHLAPDVPAIGITDGAVTAPKLASSAVESDKIKDAAITAAKIASSQITESKILDQAVSEDKLKNGSVSRQKLQACSIGPDQIDNGAITQPKIADYAVNAIKLATDAVETIKIKNYAVTKDKIADANVSPKKLEAINAPAECHVPHYDSATEKFKWTPLAPPLIYFIDSEVVFWDDSTNDIDLDINLSSWVPDGAKGILVEVIHHNTSLVALSHQVFASLKDSEPATVLFVTIPQELLPGTMLSNNGLIRLYQTTPARKSHITITRSGERTEVIVKLQGYVK